MLKKLSILIFSIVFGSVVMAQSQNTNAYLGKDVKHGHSKNVTINESDIQYWIGNGDSVAILVVYWDQTGTSPALAWGYRWSDTEGEIVVADMMDAIDNEDSRVEMDGVSSGFVNEIEYQDDNYSLSSDGMGYWMYQVNNTMAPLGVTLMPCHSGDVVEWCYMTDWSAGFPNVTTITAVPDPNAPSTPAPEDASIASEDILYWIGSGANEAIMVINFAEPDTALAWGYRFNSDSVSVADMMSQISNEDGRLWLDVDDGFLYDIFFAMGNDTLSATDFSYWMFNVNGVSSEVGFEEAYLHNGDWAKWGDIAVATITDSMEFWGEWYPVAQVWETPVTAVTPYEPAVVETPEDASIAAEDILYWVGSGSNEAIMVVNFAEPNVAYAWGYRFDEDSVSLELIMDSIAAADGRFWYEGSTGMVNDIFFVNNTDTLHVSNNSYWMFNVDGITAENYFNNTFLGNGDWAKWGDAAVATVTDSMEYWGIWYPLTMVWETPVTAVAPYETPEPQRGPFCGEVGTEGCNAIPANSNLITAWASNVVVNRGPQDIASNSTLVSYGSEEDAIGACAMNNNLAVVSLGDGGSAVVTFGGSFGNVEGPDFAVFENSFNDFFLELAFVEVSSDGEHFVRFPATSLTQTETQIDGIGTVDPTFINNLAGKFRMGYGTPFDLEELRDSADLDINHIVAIRIIDVVGSINPEYASYDAFGNMINDPYPTDSYSGGFDLDGVAILAHLDLESISETEGLEVKVYPNPASDRLFCNINTTEPVLVQLFDVTGRKVISQEAMGTIVLDLNNLNNGVYVLRAGDFTQKIVVRK